MPNPLYLLLPCSPASKQKAQRGGVAEAAVCGSTPVPLLWFEMIGFKSNMKLRIPPHSPHIHIIHLFNKIVF